MEKIKYLKRFEVVREESAPEILAVKAKGVAELKNLISPVLIANSKNEEPAEDGVYELDFVLGATGTDAVDVEMEVDVVFRVKKLPHWVKAIKVNALENSDIELI